MSPETQEEEWDESRGRFSRLGPPGQYWLFHRRSRVTFCRRRVRFEDEEEGDGPVEATARLNEETGARGSVSGPLRPVVEIIVCLTTGPSATVTPINLDIEG